MPADTYQAVIAGTATVTAVGDSTRECYDNLLAGQTGLGPLIAYPSHRFGVRTAYQVKVADRTERELGLASKLLTDVVQAAATDAGLDSLRDVPVIVGTGLGETRTVESAWLAGSALSPGADTLATAVKEVTDARDVQVFSNACSASLYALAAGCDLLAQGRHDAVLVAGVDVLSQSMFGLLDRVHLDPPTSLRPFETTRMGVIMGEGAAAVVLRRAAPGTDDVTVTAVALGCDAFHATAPDVDGIEHTIRQALTSSGVKASSIDAVFAHGTGTILNDAAEATALSRVLPGTVPVTSVKGATGHTSGGSGLFSVCMAVETIRRGQLPGTHGLDKVDPAARSLSLASEPRDLGAVSTVQVDAFGFGGLNAVAILQKSAEPPPAPARPQPSRRPGLSRALLTGPYGAVDILDVGMCFPDLGVHDLDTLLAGAPATVEPFDLRAAIGRKGYRTMTPATRAAVVAADRALGDNWDLNERAGTTGFYRAGLRRGVVAASSHGNTETVCLTAQAIDTEGVRATSPLELPNASRNVLASTLAIRHGVTGVCLTMDNGSMGGWDGLRWAVELLRSGRCDEVLYVCAEAPSEAVRALTGQDLTHGAVALLLGRTVNTAEAVGGQVPATGQPTLPGEHGTLEPALSVAAALAFGDQITVLQGTGGAWKVRTP